MRRCGVHKCVRILAIAATGLLLGACATIVEGSDQSITVTSDPSGATCELERAGSIVAVVNPTPGTARVDKSREHISVRCEKDGYQPAATTANSDFQGMTFGNIVFGGLIGVAVDASSGAMNKYPAHVVVRLAPESFPNEPARDRHFDQELEIARKEGDAAIARIRQTCGAGEECDAAADAIRAEVRSRVAEIEVQRARARVAT